MLIRMNDFEKMCRELSKRKICNNHICKGENEYICARLAVCKYVNNDKNRLLKIKAEATTSNWMEFVSILLSLFALEVATMTLLHEVYNQNGGLIIGVITLFFLYVVGLSVYFYPISYWKKYIVVAIQELE